MCLMDAQVFAAASQATPQVLPLWPAGQMPGHKKLDKPETCENGRVRHVETPTLTVHLPPKDKANGMAVVICPGGGYYLLAVDHEGTQVAQWLNSLGIAGIVLKYRHFHHQHPYPLMDAQRAVQTARANAAKWRLDPGKIGILGFSAGGHLASTAGTHFIPGTPDSPDLVSRLSSRPDFMVLVYPVISFTAPFTHRGSRKNLMGADPDKERVRSLSNELQVTKETPPTFLAHCTDDRGVPPENSISFYTALKKAGVSAEMHIYSKGGHGFGMLADRCPAAGEWPKACAVWLKQLAKTGKPPK